METGRSPVTDTSKQTPARRGLLRTLLQLALVNVVVLLALLVPVELIFGTWIREMTLGDLKRFSIPIGVTFEFDTSKLYSGGPRNPIHYTRDQWGLRGSHGAPGRVELLTIGGSTTEQRYLDDQATWQEAMGRQLQALGHPLVVANAGVDGQSTVGHVFNFDYWFPLLPELRPRIMLFYVGANDVLRHEQRVAFDSSVDARSWKVRSATFQLLRTVRSNMRARSVNVQHGRMADRPASDFTEQGLMSAADRTAVAGQITASFLANVETLRQRAAARGAIPIFVTQTAFGWNADRHPARGLKDTIGIHGLTVNLADVAYLHKDLNRGLLEFCERQRVACFDVANDVAFEQADYYDNLHNTPRGAEKIGKYLAERVA
jgi:lysophospholipase L1-like esterase